MKSHLKKAIDFYKKGKISLKKAWKFSGLDFISFIEELKKRNVEPPIPEKIDEYTSKEAEKMKL